MHEPPSKSSEFDLHPKAGNCAMAAPARWDHGLTMLSTPAKAATEGDHGWGKLLHRGATGAFLISLTGAGLGFAAHLFVARLVGKSDYGIYALMLSWVSVLAVVAQAGQDFNVVRFLPTYVLRGEWGKARGLRYGLGIFVFAISTAVALAGCAVVYVIGAHHTGAWRATFYFGFAMLPVLAQLQQSGALHRAFKRAATFNVYTNVVRGIVLIGLLFALTLVVRRIDAPMAAVASAVSAVIALAASAWHLSRAWPAAGRRVRSDYELSRWIRMGLQLSVFSIVWVVGNRVDVLILGGLMGTDNVGPYYAAVQIANFCLYGLNAVNVILGPMIAERYDAGDLAGLQLIGRRATRLSLAGALATGIFFVAVGPWILEAFGPGFRSAYLPLLILISGCCLAAGFGPVDSMLALTQYQKQISLIVLFGVVVNGVLALALVPRLGVMGAAVAWAVSLVVWRFIALRYSARHLGINISIFTRHKLTS